MDILIYIVVIICVFLGWQYSKYREMYIKIAHIPGPPKVSIFGNLLSFIGQSAAEHLNMLEEMAIKYPQIRCFMFGSQPIVMMSHPKYTEIFLSSNRLIEKSHEYRFLKDWIGTGLLTATDKKWFTRRKVITPAFHFKILDQYVGIFDKLGDTFVETLERTNGQAIDVYQSITLLALDNICGKFLNLIDKIN